ncbi:tRNA threonylcarbamoyladenosine dehydratase [Hydrogenophaga sp. BPS33]|uniref:tRNA threonylcarbamoyladenosine dehydratase n=1 Tax=Hydrogenophaga sp. BPS33 TaxID=2651974 RepID=UPI00131FA021|nr:tRNA threonylcarbamoyladenosine dehydratase [Hydrogenophaga sp. BPS33]QHE86004.1 tRNA threonylcarbamoyladenosine dehydratase [Hydrogenophaga sp. BPS33]
MSSNALPSEVFERRFGGLRRLYGVAGAQCIFDAHVVVVGIGGVGSWAVEALARSGVRRLTLIDLDHVSESNINRQIHALEPTLGQAKAEAMRERIALFHPGCVVDVIDDFVAPDNWPALLDALPAEARQPSALIDACDQMRAKTVLAHWAGIHAVPFVTVGAAGGKRQAQAVEVTDLAETTHDPLLAQLRYQLRKHHQGARQGRMGVACVFSREAVAPPDASCAIEGDVGDGSLNCHGYGSVVSVTATFGMAAAGWVMNVLANAHAKKSRDPQRPVSTTL